MILNSIADRHGFQIHALSVEEDHVHIFLENRPSQSISQIIQYLKGVSSRELRKVFPELKGYHENRLWSGGKFFRPIGEVTPKKVEHYINESQSSHYTDISDDSFAIQKESNHLSEIPQTSLQALLVNKWGCPEIYLGEHSLGIRFVYSKKGIS